MTIATLNRRRWLGGAAALALPTFGGLAWSAAAATETATTEGPARKRPMAVKASCLDITQAGNRLVAVGERGHVLLSDDLGQQWRQAAEVPTRATLTAVHATDDKQLWAVGHGGVILRSADAGEHWAIAFGKADGPDVLLSIRVEADGHGLAVGGFGIAWRTADGGASWTRAELLAGEAGERHLNRIFVGADGAWLIAAEAGTMARSEDRGERWEAVSTPYKGSLWGGVGLDGGTLVACGMRGNVLRSTDSGRTWVHTAIPGAGSLTAAARLADRRCVLVGVDGTLVTGNADGADFSFHRLEDRSALTGVVVLPGGGLAVASTSGAHRVSVPT